MKEVLERFPDRKKEIASLIQVMTREGELVRISEDLNFHRDALARLREEYRKLLDPGREGDAGELQGTDRAYTKIHHPAHGVFRHDEADHAGGRAPDPPGAAGISDHRI